MAMIPRGTVSRACALAFLFGSVFCGGRAATDGVGDDDDASVDAGSRDEAAAEGKACGIANSEDPCCPPYARYCCGWMDSGGVCTPTWTAGPNETWVCEDASGW